MIREMDKFKKRDILYYNGTRGKYRDYFYFNSDVYNELVNWFIKLLIEDVCIIVCITPIIIWILEHWNLFP